MGRSTLKILGGELRGRRLEVAAGTRPTEARVREALFSIWGPDLRGGRFLDLFAGSGAVGLEALSRGASHSCFVETARPALAALGRNCRMVEASRVSVHKLRLPLAADRERGSRLRGRFDFVFADPPYRFTDHLSLGENAARWVANTGELVIEHSVRMSVTLSDLWETVDERRYGESGLSFFRLSSS